MGKRGRTAQRTGSGRRGNASGCIFLREQLEIELVGIIGPGEVRPGSGDADTVLLDGDEDLLALVESLRATPCAGAHRGQPSGRGACTCWDGPLH